MVGPVLDLKIVCQHSTARTDLRVLKYRVFRYDKCTIFVDKLSTNSPRWQDSNLPLPGDASRGFSH